MSRASEAKRGSSAGQGSRIPRPVPMMTSSPSNNHRRSPSLMGGIAALGAGGVSGRDVAGCSAAEWAIAGTLARTAALAMGVGAGGSATAITPDGDATDPVGGSCGGITPSDATSGARNVATGCRSLTTEACAATRIAPAANAGSGSGSGPGGIAGVTAAVTIASFGPSLGRGGPCNSPISGIVTAARGPDVHDEVVERHARGQQVGQHAHGVVL